MAAKYSMVEICYHLCNQSINEYSIISNFCYYVFTNDMDILAYINKQS